MEMSFVKKSFVVIMVAFLCISGCFQADTISYNVNLKQKVLKKGIENVNDGLPFGFFYSEGDNGRYYSLAIMGVADLVSMDDTINADNVISILTGPADGVGFTPGSVSGTYTALAVANVDGVCIFGWLNLTLLKADGPGGRILGSFNGLMADHDENLKVIANGSINVATIAQLPELPSVLCNSDTLLEESAAFFLPEK